MTLRGVNGPEEDINYVVGGDGDGAADEGEGRR